MGRHILALGGGGFELNPTRKLQDYILASAHRENPRIGFVPTAQGESDYYVVRFYETCATLPCRPSHLSLFRRQGIGLRDFVMSQDLIWVGGGNTANMLAVWRVHGLDAILKEAWESGIVLAGVSAGAICWFESGVTDSFGGLAPLHGGLGFLAGSFCPHYDSEPQRRPTFRQLVEDGLPAGIAADDGVALHFEGTDLSEIVADRPNAGAYRVERAEGGARETALPTRLLA